MTLNNPIVYTCFCTDIIHEGHLNLIKEAKKYGDVIVGVLCDSEMVKYNQFPLKSTEQRMEIVKNISGIKDVVVQNEIMYDNIIKEIRPDYVIHGNNWEEDSMKLIRKNIIEVTSRYGGELIEIPYTFNEHVQKIDKQMKEKLAMPELRRARLKRLLDIVPIVKTIEVHSGLTGLIAEKTVLADGEVIDQFEAMWVSSLCDSTEKGKPDIELVDMTSRFRTINDIMEVTTKPIIFDGDTGGIAEHFVYTVRSLERMGVSAIIIEDKVGLKKNSLFGTDVEQTQDDIEHFCEKIAAGKKHKFLMISWLLQELKVWFSKKEWMMRLKEHLHLGMQVLMESWFTVEKKDPSEILEFCDKFRDEDQKTPIVVVPSSFNSITESELKKHGVNIVIYANQLLRAAFPAMQDAAKSILKHHRAEEIDNKLMSIKDIITLIDEI